MKKRVLSLFLAITLCLTLTPTGALAAEGQPPEQTVSATQEAQIPAPALEEKEEEKTTPAQTGAGENAPPANPEENPTEDAPAAAEKNTADEETGKQAVQNEPTMEGKNELPALNDAGQSAAGGGIYVAPGSPTEGGGGTYIPGEDKRTEIRCVSKPDSIGRSYDGTTDGGTIPIDLTFTDGTNEIKLKEGTGFTAKKTFDSADAGWHTVTVEIALIGEAAVKYKLKAGEETFTIGGNINKAYPKLTVSLSQTACTAGEKLLPLLSVEGAPEDAEVTYYYLASALKSWAGSSDVEGSDAMPKIDENTAISEPGTYYVYAKTGETKNYEEERSTTAELTVNEAVVEAASVTKKDGTDGGTYESLPAALNAAQNGDTVTLLSDVDLGETYVTISKSITFDLNGKTLSSSKTWSSDGVLLVKNATVTVKNGTVKATGIGSCAIRAYRSGASMTLEAVTATVTSNKSSVMVGDFGSAVIKSGDYQGLYVGAKSQVTLKGGTFRPYMDTMTNENVKSIFWKVNETTDATSRDCMELLGDGCVYVDENRTQVRTGGGFNTVVTVQQGTAIDAPVAKIGNVEYASLSKAIDAVQNGGTITLLDDLDLGNGAVLQVGSSQKNFTIDLDNHTLSADGACLIMLHNGSQLTLKNGTLDGSRCTSYEGVLYISSNSGPKLTLENVTAKSGTVPDTLNGQRSVLLAYVTYGTVEFDGGTYTGGVLLKTDGNAVLKSGTFRKGTNNYSIKTEDSGKHLSDYLDESLFWNGDTVLDLSSETQTADEVTVRPCEHNWENGKCTVCQKVCDHGSADGKSMTEDPCHTCGMKAAAQVDITGSDAKYFPSFTDALVYATKNNGCTLKLLADVTGTTVMINNPFLFDLNGHNVDALSVDARATIKDSGTTKGRIGKVTVSNEKVTDLTLGDLLEEGYAFKYETGYWADDSHKETISGLKVTVEKAPIQSVKIYAKDKNHKEVPTTMAYGTTGEVTLVSSCRMGETSGADLSYLWYKLEGAAATAPLEGATGANYTLPDNLAAGTHTYLLICTSGGYSKSAEITITVTPVSLEGAEVTVENPTYNGQKQFPAVTVKLDENTTLTKGTDFYVDATMQANAGSYTLTVNGNGNYSGKIENVEWKIEPMKIDSVMVSSAISKVYDGTAEINMSANEWATALKFKTLSASGVVDVPSEAYTISDAYFVKKSGEETIYSPDAGEKYGITFKITLNDDNYVLQTYGEDTPSTSKVITQSGGATFTIKQATVTSPGEITQLVFNDLAKTYTIDLAKLLPKLSEGCEYGDIQYQGCDYHFTDSTYLDSNNGMSVSEEGILTLPTVSAHTSDVNTQIGTITVPVVTTNYQNFEFTIKVYISARIPPNASGVTVSASDITYGQMLNESKLTATGTMKHPGTGEEVKGTFAWTNPEAKPGAAGDYTASWTFTPAAGYEEYAPATGTVTIKVNKATPTFTAPTAQENLTYTGQEQALITAGMTDHGTMLYSLTENGTYSQDIPTGTDAGAYTVWYRVIGDANHNDTAPASVAVSIGKKPLTITGVTVAPKPYDGTTNADISSVTFDNVTLNRGTDYTVTASFDDAGVGNGKNVTATVTLTEQTAKNYALEQSSFPTTGSITKAAAPDFTKETALTIVNGHEKTYTVTLPALPTLETPKAYGALTYEIGEIKLNDGYYTSGAKVENGELTLPIQKNDVETTGSVGTVTVVIKSINYKDITLTVKVSAVNQIKPVPDGTITATPITYGNELSASTITGTMQDPVTGVAVNGTFTWDTPAVKLNAGSHNAKWTFTPDKSYGGKYTTNTGTATVTVNPKAVTVSGITANDKVYDGTTNAGLDYSAVTLGGVLENDTLTVTATGTMESADVGEKKVTISNLTLGGDSAANYVLAESGNQTETTATITAKEVTATITPNGGTYGSVTAAAAELSGAVDGENVPVTLTYTGNGYNDTAVPVNAGSYTVTASIANSNYTLTGNTTADFVITPKAVTVSGITANDKVYDGTTNAVLDYSNAQFDGILENDKLTVAAKGMFEKAEAGKQNVAISDLKLGGDSAANYVLAESGNQTETTATITAKEVTVTPDNKSKVYEEKDPKLTYIVSGVLSGETLKGITLARAEGENAGEYDITATADAGANPNYEVTFAEGKFTINPKSIDGATVKLGKALTANGAEQTQTVEKVLLNDKELPADSYTVAGNTATDPGSHTLTITAKGNYTGAVEQTYVIVPAKAEDAPDKEITIGNGKVKVDIKFEGTVPPATLLTDKAELLAMLVDSGDITADELAQIADGAIMDIVLTVKEANVPDAVKTAMAQAAKDYTIGQYLDISLFKYMTVNGNRQPGAALHTTKNALPISVVVPDALIHTDSAVNRNYCIVRCHEGAIAVLDAAFDAANKTLTFKTDRFSVYAIAYKDTAVPSSGSNPGSNNSSNDSETKKNEVAAPTPAPTPASTSKPSTITAMPQTGDTSNPTLYVVLLVASLLGLAVVFVCKKRNDK
jgi:LPXTG-motif cell wall-anchored protein